MSEPPDPQARLEALRNALIGLRIPLLLAGLSFLLFAGTSALSTVTSMLVAFGVTIESSRDATPYLIAHTAIGMLFLLWDLFLSALLVGSGSFGMAARFDPKHLLWMVRLLCGFWMLLVLRILASIATTIGGTTFMNGLLS